MEADFDQAGLLLVLFSLVLIAEIVEVVLLVVQIAALDLRPLLFLQVGIQSIGESRFQGPFQRPGKGRVKASPEVHERRGDRRKAPLRVERKGFAGILSR